MANDIKDMAERVKELMAKYENDPTGELVLFVGFRPSEGGEGDGVAYADTSNEFLKQSLLAVTMPEGMFAPIMEDFLQFAMLDYMARNSNGTVQ